MKKIKASEIKEGRKFEDGDVKVTFEYPDGTNDEYIVKDGEYIMYHKVDPQPGADLSYMLHGMLNHDRMNSSMIKDCFEHLCENHKAEALAHMTNKSKIAEHFKVEVPVKEWARITRMMAQIAKKMDKAQDIKHDTEGIEDVEILEKMKTVTAENLKAKLQLEKDKALLDAQTALKIAQAKNDPEKIEKAQIMIESVEVTQELIDMINVEFIESIDSPEQLDAIVRKVLS